VRFALCFIGLASGLRDFPEAHLNATQAYTFARQVNMSHIIDGIIAFGIIAVFVICGPRNRIFW
jgi:hypothetical protein